MGIHFALPADYLFPTPNTSLLHNHIEIMRGLQCWAKTQISWGTRADWDEAAQGVAQHKMDVIRKIRLWADSTDFPLPRKKEIRSKKGEHWSFKENRPAQRYMAISDGKTRIRARGWLRP